MYGFCHGALKHDISTHVHVHCLQHAFFENLFNLYGDLKQDFIIMFAFFFIFFPLEFILMFDGINIT